MAAAGETVRAIKACAPQVPVVLEGVVPSAYPERMLREEGADLVCQGEPFDPIVNLLRFFGDRGSTTRLGDDQIEGLWARYEDDLVRSRHSPMFREVDRLPMTAWDLMPPANYRAHHWHCFDRLDQRTPYASIFTGLGCPYACSFCSVNVVAGSANYRAHSPEHVLRELDVLVNRYGVRNVRILDNVFTVRLDLVEQLCDQIMARGYDLNLWAYARVESIRNPEILVKMKKAGVNWLAYGFEAAHERVRQAVNKPSSRKVMEQAIEWTKQAGISIVGNYIFGLPEDDLESMRMSFDMAREHNFEWANFYCAMAYPGTKLYDQALAQGVALPKNWSAYGQYSPDAQPLATKYVRSREVLAFRDAAFKEYYTSPRYQGMIEKKFGPAAVAFVKKILSFDVPRVGADQPPPLSA